MSVACWQRVLNRQPAGGLIGEGSSPSMSPSLTSTVGAQQVWIVDDDQARVFREHQVHFGQDPACSHRHVLQVADGRRYDVHHISLSRLCDG